MPAGVGVRFKRTCDCIYCDGGCKRQKLESSVAKPHKDYDKPDEEPQPEFAYQEWDYNHDVIDVDDEQETWADESAPVLPTKNWVEDLEKENGEIRR